MKIFNTLQEAIYTTIHRSKKTIGELAEDLGVSENLLYKYASAEGTTSYSDIPLRKLIAIIKNTENDAILDYLEYKRGRIAFKMPKVAMCRMEESEMVDDYQEANLNAVKAFRDFLSKQTKENYLKLEGALNEVMSKSAAIQKYATKKASGQFEIFE